VLKYKKFHYESLKENPAYLAFKSAGVTFIE
jgi:hypothetical protein